MKYKADESIERYKARLVAKGYTHRMELITNKRLLRWKDSIPVGVFLSIATNLDWPLLQLDVKNAFLNEKLEKGVYMDISSGFVTEALKHKMRRLKRLYTILSSLFGPGFIDLRKY